MWFSVSRLAPRLSLARVKNLNVVEHFSGTPPVEKALLGCSVTHCPPVPASRACNWLQLSNGQPLPTYTACRIRMVSVPVTTIASASAPQCTVASRTRPAPISSHTHPHHNTRNPLLLLLVRNAVA